MRIENKEMMDKMYNLLMEVTEIESSFCSVQRTEVMHGIIKNNYKDSDSVLLEDFINDVEQGLLNIKEFYRKKR